MVGEEVVVGEVVVVGVEVGVGEESGVGVGEEVGVGNTNTLVDNMMVYNNLGNLFVVDRSRLGNILLGSRAYSFVCKRPGMTMEPGFLPLLVNNRSAGTLLYSACNSWWGRCWPVGHLGCKTSLLVWLYWTAFFLEGLEACVEGYLCFYLNFVGTTKYLLSEFRKDYLMYRVAHKKSSCLI